MLQALQSVATVFLADEMLPEALREQIVEHMVTVHQSVRTFSQRFLEELRRYNYVTPKNYLVRRGGEGGRGGGYHAVSVCVCVCICI